MTSEWENTPWSGSDSKAVIGPYASRVEYGIQLASLNNSPQKRMREAQALYWTNPWIRTAETVVTRRVVGLDWHLENATDDDLSDNVGGIEGEAYALIERPQTKLPDVGRKMTRRELWAITSRHMGLCGVAFWFLDQLDPIAKTPLGVVYLNPARVWPATDAHNNLTGWVIDPKDDSGRGGTPLTLDEVLPFYLDPPDSGYYGRGLVDAAYQKAQITNLADRHSAYILGTGGRLPGIVSPKEGTIPDESYRQLVNEFRAVNEAPDAAKRTTVVRGPIDFTSTSADPAQLALIDISKLNRDDIFAIWGVPPSQAGVTIGGVGLNSGESRRYEEQVLMAGAVHDRVVVLSETIQYGLLDRYQTLGTTIELEIEEPEYGDQTAQFDNAQKALNLPLRNVERRAIIGLGPIGDDLLDNAIVIPANLVEYGATLPVLSTKADRPFLGLRSKIDSRFVPATRKSIHGALLDQRAEVVSRLRSHPSERAMRDTTVWWNGAREHDRLAKVLDATAKGIAITVARQVGDLLKNPGKADPVSYEDAVVQLVQTRTGDRITKINDTTLSAVRSAITQGFDDGLSPAQVADLIEGLPAFDEARAELVARTETMFAYNDAALTSYRQFDVTEVLAYDGDMDDECASRNGQTYDIFTAYDITDHPNGTLDWAPILAPIGKATVEPVAQQPATLRLEVGESPVIPAPIVHIEAPAPTPAPIVNVDMAPLAAMMERALSRQPKIVRDAEGRIVGLEMVPG